jgi:hypothetical protein
MWPGSRRTPPQVGHPATAVALAGESIHHAHTIGGNHMTMLTTSGNGGLLTPEEIRPY